MRARAALSQLDDCICKQCCIIKIDRNKFVFLAVADPFPGIGENIAQDQQNIALQPGRIAQGPAM